MCVLCHLSLGVCCVCVSWSLCVSVQSVDFLTHVPSRLTTSLPVSYFSDIASTACHCHHSGSDAALPCKAGVAFYQKTHNLGQIKVQEEKMRERERHTNSED